MNLNQGDIIQTLNGDMGVVLEGRPTELGRVSAKVKLDTGKTAWYWADELTPQH